LIPAFAGIEGVADFANLIQSYLRLRFQSDASTGFDIVRRPSRGIRSQPSESQKKKIFQFYDANLARFSHGSATASRDHFSFHSHFERFFSMTTYKLVFSVTRLLLVLGCLAVFHQRSAHAQPASTVVYQWRPELGGWHDTSNNLVWGYQCYFTPGNYTYSLAPIFAANYASSLATAATEKINSAVRCEERVILYAISDPPRSQRNADLALIYRADAPALQTASAQAAQYSNWRVPSLVEFQQAWNKGFFTKGTGGFNWDAGPEVGLQPSTDVSHWTSTLSKRRGQAMLFNFRDGGSGSFGMTSTAAVIVVRTHVP